MNAIEQPECPICYDCIGDKNNITTECGHKFHASCLMTNVSRNGFDCPCCRAVMATEAIDNEDGNGSMPPLYIADPDDGDDDTLLDEDVEEPFSDDALRGLRLLTDLLEGSDHDQADVVAEHQYTADIQNAAPLPVPPPHEFMLRAFREQGITYEQLVAWTLMDHDEYEDSHVNLQSISGDIWGKLRIIITNYVPEEPLVVQEPVVVQEPLVVQEPVVVQEPLVVQEPFVSQISPIPVEEEDFDLRVNCKSFGDPWCCSCLTCKDYVQEMLRDMDERLKRCNGRLRCEAKTPICV